MQAWEAFLSQLETTHGKQVVDRWLRPLKVVDFDACNLYLEPQDSFQVAWFEEHIRKKAKESFCNSNGHPIQIHFSKKKQAKKPQHEAPPSLEIESDPVDPSTTFTNFITDEQTELIVNFLRKMEPGNDNPIFLNGPQGTGKTHLLMACAQILRARGLSVFYVHTESFTNHVVKAIRSSQMRQFREIYRNQDVLIIDDVHHLARKSATQEELFHTFNTLHTSGRQIILSSHLLPSQLEEIEPRLISRFEWGIVLSIAPLPPKQIENVLRSRAAYHHFPLSDALATYLVDTFSSSTKSVMRSLDALLLRHKESSSLSVLQAETILQDLIEAEKKSLLTPDKIINAVSAYFGITPKEILGKSQAKECVVPRKIGMYLIRKKLSLSYLAIGRHFSRDHSTVMTSIKQIQQKKDEELASSIEEITLQLDKE